MSQNCFVDYLGFTFSFENLRIDDAREKDQFAMWLICQLVGTVPVTDTKTGWSGYARRLNFPGGLLAYGGNSDTLHVQLTGEGCSMVLSWSDTRALLEKYSAKITRVDIAHDDEEGRDISIAWGLRQHAESGFKPPRGVSPRAHMHDDLGSGAGCTLYVGSRDSGKMFRLYEKGKQLGDPTSPWCRAEVEFRATHRVLEYDMLTEPARYFAGAYQCLSAASKWKASCVTFMRKAAACIEKAIDHSEKQAGGCIAALLDLGYTAEQIIQKIAKTAVPDRLIPTVDAIKKHFKRATENPDDFFSQHLADLHFHCWRTA